MRVRKSGNAHVDLKEGGRYFFINLNKQISNYFIICIPLAVHSYPNAGKLLLQELGFHLQAEKNTIYVHFYKPVHM